MVDPCSGNYDNLPHVGPGNIESFTGRLYDNVNTVKDDALISGKFHFDPGDIIYGKINPQLGKYTYAQFEGLASADAYVLNGKNGLTQEFLFGILQTKAFFDYSVSVSMRSGMPKINRDELNAFEFLAPNESEQRAIGDILLKLDDLITLHQRKCQYRGLYGYLSWEQRKLGEVAHRVIRKNEGNQSDLPLTISAQHGLVDQRDYFNNQVASRDMSGYYLLESGEFAYNKSTSGDSPWGAIKRLTKYEKGCLSTLYICFGLDLGDPDFLVTYYETNRWHSAVQMIAAEGARNHGLLNITPDDFFETVLTLPCSTEEQKQIGCFFTQLNSLITLHQ